MSILELTKIDRQREGAFILLALFLFGAFFYFDRWPREINGGDPFGYYMHLPATFIYQDVGDYSKTLTAASEYFQEIRLPAERNIHTVPTPTGLRADKYPLGVAVMIAPFFGAAHAFCTISGLYPADGFSKPYVLLCGLATIFYVLWGLGMLYYLLLRYFRPGAAALTILIIGLATNLFYLSVWNNLMAHAFLFFQISWLLDRTIRFWDKPDWRRAVLVGVSAGLVGLTRTHDLVVGIVPLVWGLVSWASLRERFQFFLRKWYFFAAAALAGLVVLMPQILYYKMLSGKWWWYAYVGETFNFNKPHILDGLFHYSNGWLVYTPVMFFVFPGFFLLWRYARQAFWPLVLFFPVYLYLIYSWWCWNYINRLGSRPMADIYGLLAFPLAAFLHWNGEKKVKQVFNVAIFILFAGLNIFQTWQEHEGILWSQDENGAHFWHLMGKTGFDPEGLILFESNERQPGPGIQRQAILLTNDMEDSIQAPVRSRELAHGGQFSVPIGEQEFAGGLGMKPEQLQSVKPGDWLRVSVWGYIKPDDIVWDRSQLAVLTLVIQHADGHNIKYRHLRIASKIGNPEGNLWHCGKPGEWGEASFFVKIPDDFKPDMSIKAYVWNPNKTRLFIDDLSVEHWR